MSPKQRSTWRKLFSPHQIKASYVSGTNISERRFTGIYKNLLSMCSENAVLGRLKMVQCNLFFLTLTGSMFLAVLLEHIIYNVKWAEFPQMSEGFWAKLYCKMGDPFC